MQRTPQWQHTRHVHRSGPGTACFRIWLDVRPALAVQISSVITSRTNGMFFCWLDHFFFLLLSLLVSGQAVFPSVAKRLLYLRNFGLILSVLEGRAAGPFPLLAPLDVFWGVRSEMIGGISLLSERSPCPCPARMFCSFLSLYYAWKVRVSWSGGDSGADQSGCVVISGDVWPWPFARWVVIRCCYCCDGRLRCTIAVLASYLCVVMILLWTSSDVVLTDCDSTVKERCSIWACLLCCYEFIYLFLISLAFIPLGARSLSLSLLY